MDCKAALKQGLVLLDKEQTLAKAWHLSMAKLSRWAWVATKIRCVGCKAQQEVLGGLTQQQYRDRTSSIRRKWYSAQRAGAAGIAGLGQQGYNMLTGQIGTMAGLGQTGRGIQDRAYGNQYTAATQMADEPYMRLQRGQQMLGGLSGYLPQYQSGYQTSRNVKAQADPSDGSKARQVKVKVGSFF